MRLRSKDDPQLGTWLSDRKYFSPDIILLNEQIELIANSVLRGILSEIHVAGWFSIIADEETDVRRCEQMCVCIRWVDNEYKVNEDPIGLVQVPKTDSSTFLHFKIFVYVACFH